jgi:hypothetical protein
MAVVIPKITFPSEHISIKQVDVRITRFVEIPGSNLTCFTGTSETLRGILQYAEENNLAIKYCLLLPKPCIFSQQNYSSGNYS